LSLGPQTLFFPLILATIFEVNAPPLPLFCLVTVYLLMRFLTCTFTRWAFFSLLITFSFVFFFFFFLVFSKTRPQCFPSWASPFPLRNHIFQAMASSYLPSWFFRFFFFLLLWYSSLHDPSYPLGLCFSFFPLFFPQSTRWPNFLFPIPFLLAPPYFWYSSFRDLPALNPVAPPNFLPLFPCDFPGSLNSLFLHL